ncbi:RNA helicase [Malassezia cuniculi]|uniref:ATP-dependent RNA helicase n=1 Tax=Malassezia cuniculi TaxID=948313 RepID=A0AAF0J5P1_9BASI|nr:RNA helicase [Malassezia cuniculi]
MSMRAAPAAHAAAPKAKTKAKQRYLRAKKERRKARKLAAPKRPGSAMDEKQDNNEAESSSSDEDDDESASAASDAPEEPTHIDATPLQPHVQDVREAQEAQNDTPATTGAPGDAMHVDASAEPALYRFPRPQKTIVADAAELAALGVPQGMDAAMVVDPALTRPVEETAQICGVEVSHAVKRQLDRLGISEWFAVQASVIPLLLQNPATRKLYMPYTPPRDICVSAPTGSGKTLAYTVPLIEALRARVVVRLRALILVPTRDLALQVFEMFEAVGRGSGLRVALATGSHSFKHEQAQLVGNLGTNESPEYTSLVDVLIATPGRLVDHISGTPGLSLEHLRFLVVDEADRLLGQSFQQWVSVLLDAIERSAPKTEPWTRDDMDTASSSVQKLLFSATLTRDPAKLGALKLRNPQYVSVGDGAMEERYAFPPLLHEHMVITDAASKVLHLIALLHDGPDPVRQALCFTKSVEAANRLVRLLTFFEECWAKETGSQALSVRFYSSDLSAQQRMQMLREFRTGSVDILVCSDLIARGIDLPEVRHVVSYDVPIEMAKYVHRVGRTARAGREGDAWTLVEEQEVFHFKQMLRRAGRLEHVESCSTADTERFMPSYKGALAQLARVYSQQHVH